MSNQLEFNGEEPEEEKPADPEPKKPKKARKKKSKLAGKKAKRAFLIVRNDFRSDIREGDDLSDIPDEYYDNLKTEGVI
jgi:hypothetical protein